jgi:nitroreductase
MIKSIQKMKGRCLSMDVFEAIKGRRSIGMVKQDLIKQEVIEQLLEAATWAPNHHHTEPWRKQ